MSNLALNLVASAARIPDRTAAITDETDDDIRRVRRRSRPRGDAAGAGWHGPGDRVGVMLPNTPAFAIVFYGIMYGARSRCR